MTFSQRVVKRPILITIVFAILMVMALYSVRLIPLDLIPSISPPYVMINTTYMGAGPETVEKTVTKVLEAGLSSVQGIKSMTSTSSEGSSAITLEFNYGKDLDKAANDIRDKVDSVRDRLPGDCSAPSIFKLDPNSMAIIKVALRGNRTAEELKKIAEDTVKTRFEGTDGVSAVSILGGREEVVRVDISLNRLQAYGLTIQSVASALAMQNVELGAGTINENKTNYSVRTIGSFSSIGDDIANAQVATKNGVPIHLKDIATVFDGYKDVTTNVFINGEQGIYLSITKQSGKNTVSVADSLYKVIKNLNKSLPGDVKLVIVNDTSVQVRTTVYDLIRAIIEGAILTLLFVFFFLRNIRSTIIIGLTLPIAVLITLLAMYFCGFSLNMMTMAGLLVSIGSIVDASIVVIDSITVFRERGTKAIVAADIGTHEVMVAVTAGILTSVVTFLPIVLFINQLGMMGLLFKDMLFTVIISHLVSLAVAMTLVPVLASHYLPLTTRAENPIKNKTLAAIDSGIGNGIEAVKRAYLKFLGKCLAHRRVTITVILALVVGSIVIFLPKLTIVMSPGMADNSITLDITEPVGTTFETTEDIVNKFAEIAGKELNGIGNIIATTGSSGGWSSDTASYSGSLTINLADDTSKRVDSFATIKTKIRAHFKDYPNVTFNFEEGHRMSSRSDIDVTITSNNYTGMNKTSDEIVALMKSDMSEILEPTTNTQNGLPQIEVAIDRERAASFGISVSTIATEIRDAVKGYQSTVYRKGGDEYDVWIRLQPSDREKMLDLNNIFVLSSSGKQIPLSNLATITKGWGPVKIHRTNQSRTIDITGNLVQGKQANKVEAKLQNLIKSKITIPDDVYVTYTGSWSELTGQSSSLLAIVILSLILVWGVMAAQYESFKGPFINLTTIPIMLIGVLAIYYFRGQNLSMYTMLGIIMLIGIVVNNGILMVDATNLSIARGEKLMDACLKGSASRFRPVLITAGATIMGEIPMAFFPSDNSAITQPIGLAVFGGMITATLITLIIIPVVYFIINKGDAKRKGYL